MPSFSPAGDGSLQHNGQVLPPQESPPSTSVTGLATWQVEALQKLTHTAPLLVTDDDLMSRRFYRALLADTCGLTLIETGDPTEALKICQAQAVSLVISCIIKPTRMDGLKLVSDLRASAETRAIPLMIVTAALNTRELAFEAGADAYLSKPCHPNEILQEIWRLLRNRAL